MQFAANFDVAYFFPMTNVNLFFHEERNKKKNTHTMVVIRLRKTYNNQNRKKKFSKISFIAFIT